jgi:hypothetical protein
MNVYELLGFEMQIIVMIQKIVTPLLLKPGPFKIAYK